MRLGRVLSRIVLAACLTPSAVRAQSAPSRDDELKSHLAALARRLSDTTTDVVVRERIAMEMATTLDRAALNASASADRRAYWTEAAGVLDRFSESNPGHPESRAFKVQSAVYAWARGRDRMQAARLRPDGADERRAAAEDFQASVDRLRPLYLTVGRDDVFAQNIRFRFAQALADLAEAGDEKVRDGRNAEALEALEKPVQEPSLQGFAHLLRATLLTRAGRFDHALAAVDAAATSKPPPPESELVDARVTVLTGKREWVEAVKAVDASHLDPAEKSLQRGRIKLAECDARMKGPEQEAAETALFAELKTLRKSSRPEARAMLAAAARTLREPGAAQNPEAWDLLADGAAALGDQARAGALERRAAENADAKGQKAEAVAFRLRAGAFLFQAEKFAEADPLLTKVVEDPAAGPARPRAGLLRSLGRGRALALGRPGATQADYAAALTYQIANFPDDPSADEARWLLGKFRAAESDRDSALTLWEAIPHGRPRWLESRSEIAAVRQRDLDLQRLNNDRPSIERRLADARSFLTKTLGQAQGEVERNEILLASARLELTPGVGRPEETRRVCDLILRSVARLDQRDAARRFQIVALAAQGRWVDAEQAARQEIATSGPVALIPTVRLLDRWGAESETDLKTRRIGHLIRILLSAPIERPDDVAPDLRSELQLRLARALLFNGDDAGSRRTLSSGFTPSDLVTDDLLRDLAETYARLEAYEMAVEVQRLRSKKTATGSSPWFDARYGLALAYYRAGKPKDAAHLIDATAILHPDLGGGELRDKFLRLRQRINPEE